MANVDNPVGGVPVRHLAGGTIRTSTHTIASGYAANIFRGDFVKMVTGGTIEVAAAGDVLLGVFAGCEYTNAQNERVWSPYWPTGTTATDIVAHVYDDPWIIYRIQANGTLAQTDVGACADIVAGTGSTSTGNSGHEISASTGSGTANLKILRLAPDPENAWGANCDVEVIINEHFLKQEAGI